MLRKTMIALFATAAVVMLAPAIASAQLGAKAAGAIGGGAAMGGGGGFRGGAIGGGGGFRGAPMGGGFPLGAKAAGAPAIGGGGGFRGVPMGGGFRAAAIGGGGFRPAAIGTKGAFRTAAIGGPGVIGQGQRFVPGRFHHGRFHHRFHRRPIFVTGLGLYGYPYYYDYAYNGDYYDDGCYIVNRRVYTRYGWRLRPVQVCT